MAKSKVNRASQVIVEPEELTEFLRSSRDITELAEAALKLEKDQKFKNRYSKRPDPVGIKSSLKKPKTGWKRFAGVLFALSAGLCFQVSNLIVKSLPNHHPVNLSFWRYFGYIYTTVPYIICLKLVKNVNLFNSIGKDADPSRCCGSCTVSSYSKNFTKLIVLSAVGIPIFILRFASLNYLTIADSTVIVFSGPLFTIVFGHFFLKEKCGFVTIPISCFTLLGVIVIARPPFLTGAEKMDDRVLIGISMSFSATVLAAIYFVMMRRLRHVHFIVVTFLSGMMGLLIAGGVAWIMGVLQLPKGTIEILLFVVLGLLSFLGGTCITAALKFEEAGTVSVVRMVDVLYSFLFEFAWLGVIPDVYSIVGAAIVMTGVSLITFRKILSTLPETHCLRRAFCFLLL